jgi:phage terminase large subunit-like protein
VTRYAEDVVAGRVLAGPFVRLACARHLRDLKAGRKRGLTFDAALAARAVSFFPDVLRLFEGQHAGQPFTLQPWQQFIVGALFGWKRADGSRRFRNAYIESAKGSGKSPLAAGLAIYMLTADGEASAEVYAAAVTRDQAGIMFRDADRMVAASPGLKRRIQQSVHNLAHASSGSFLRPVSSEARSLDGKRVHAAFIDEIHEHRDSLVVDKMRAGTKGRRQALIFEITNSGYDRHSVCFQHHEYSRKVVEGVIEDDAWFAYVCSLDEGDEWTDEAVWLKANPNLGVSIPLDYLREQVREAVGMPAKQNIVKRLNLCIWTEQADRWLDVALWDAMDAPVDETLLLGRRCFGGLDLSSTTDLTALALLFPPLEDEDLWTLLMRYWIPADNLMRRVQKDGVPYNVWRDQGLIRTTEGNVVDKDFIEAEVIALAGKYQLAELAFDRMFADQLVTHLMGEGLTMVPFGQGFYSMAAPTKEFERLVMGGRFAHGGHPVLRWNIANVAVRTDPAGNLKPDKEKSTERIDGVVAAIMALGRATVAPSDAPFVGVSFQ